MSVSTSDSSLNQSRVRRKPAPSLELEARYPTPDPDDPFAPLAVLRSRTASTLSSAGAPLSFRGESTSHLPTLPYTGGRYPPDIYQAYLHDTLPVTTPTPSGSNLTASFARSTSDILDSPTASGCEPESIRHPRDCTPEYSGPVPIQRRRSRSAVSRKEAARLTVPIPPRNSPYGYSKLQSYVLANALSSTPALTAEPLAISPTSSIGQSSESVQSFFSRVHSDAGCPAPSSPLRLTSFSPNDHVATPSKAKKFARLLPQKIGSRLSLTHQSTDNLALSQTNTSYTSFPHPSSERSSKPKHFSEENTFHARRKSTTLFPAEIATRLHTMDVSSPIRDSTTGYVYEPLTDAEIGLTGSLGGSSSPSHSYVPHSSPPAATVPTHVRSLTAIDGRGFGPAVNSPHKYEATRPSTVQCLSSPSFDEHALPTPRQLADAASCFVVAENGLRVPFGELFRDQRTIVVFIRHFWCPLCQDYMFSVTDNVDPRMLKDAEVNLVVIGNGSYNMIKSYRQIFRTPFTFYTDPTLRLYKALGMTLRAMEPKSQRKRGGYVRHGSMSGIAMVFKNALRVGMPVWEKAGDFTQLGGEFVLGPGMTATYAHRMPNPRSHAPIMHVLAAAGIGLQCEKLAPTTETIARAAAPVLDEEQWMEERRLSLARIRERKLARRMGVAFPSTDEAEEHQVVLPKIEPPGKLTRSDSIEEEEEEKEKEKEAQLQATLAADAVVKTESTTCQPGHGSTRSSSSTAEDGETETATVGSGTLSDSGSDRTRAEELESHCLRDKVSMMDLENPNVPVVVSL